jgi:flavodoxin
MKSLIICVSKSHGNTRRVADRMAEVFDAEVSQSTPKRSASTTS